MLKVILISIGLVGCIHPKNDTFINEPIEEKLSERVISLEKTNKEILSNIERLDNRINYIDYETMNKFCFMIRDVCTASTNGICISQYTDCLYDKKDKKECTQQTKQCVGTYQNKCFKIHEKCIVDNYRRWKPSFDEQNKKAKGGK